MDRTEQKERLKDIIDLANETIKSLLDKKDWLQKVFTKIEDLESVINEHGDVDNWDEQNLKDSVTNQLFEQELEQLYDQTNDFKDELDSYASELSEKRSEKLEERYEMLDDVLDKFSQSSSQYEEIYDVIENIQDGINELKLMRK